MEFISINDRLPANKVRVLVLIKYKNMNWFLQEDGLRITEGYLKQYSDGTYHFVVPHGDWRAETKDNMYADWEIVAWCERPDTSGF